MLPPLPGVIFWIALSTYSLFAAWLFWVGVGIVIGCVKETGPATVWAVVEVFDNALLSTYCLFAASWSAVGSANAPIFLLLKSTLPLGLIIISPLSAPIRKWLSVVLPLPKYQTLWLFDLNPARYAAVSVPELNFNTISVAVKVIGLAIVCTAVVVFDT